MKAHSKITLIIVLLTCTIYYSAKAEWTQKRDEKLRTEIEAINNQIERLYLSKDVDSLINLYATQLTFFADYKPAIYESNTLKNFFRDWFITAPVTAYKKKILAVEVYSDHILEMGSFMLSYSLIQNTQKEYKGKYMILWKRDKKGKLSIVSETLGADSYVEPEAIPFADVPVKESSFIAHGNSNKQLLKEVEAFDEVLLKAVAEGDGDARAKGFTEDAVLMAQFDSIRIGMASIRPKMLNTYKPGSTYIVKHTYSSIIDLGDYIFVTANYKGGPADPKNGGPFEGKMCSLLKRTEGKLLMHRQTGNRDKKQN